MTIIEELKDAGLSEYEAKVYYELLISGEQTGRDIAKASKVPPTRVFDVLDRLREKGLVMLIQQRPMLWLAISPESGLKTFIDRKVAKYAELQTHLIEQLKRAKQEPEQKIRETVTVVSGFREIFSLVAQCIKKSTKEVSIFSVGESIPISTEIESARAVKRGVNLKFIATLYNEKNKSLLNKWMEEGWSIRHLSGSQEYSFAIFDKSVCTIIVKNPLVQNERIMILFENRGLSKALCAYYDFLWNKAKPIATK